MWQGSQDDIKSLGGFLLACIDPRFAETSKEDKIAYLDGLRGFAALLVYCTHYTGFAYERNFRFYQAFGFNDRYYFACLPIVRILFHGGTFAVALFFIISGYVLSVSPLKLLHSHDESGLLIKRLGCSFTRRWVRLYLPVIATTFIFMSSWHLFNIQSSRTHVEPPESTYLKECARWLSEFMKGSYFLNAREIFDDNDYNNMLWSISEEFRGSVILFGMIFIFYGLGCAPNARFWSCMGVFVYFQYIVDAQYYALFVAGHLICNLTLLTDEDPYQLPRVLSYFKFLDRHRWIYYVLFLGGLYLGDCPHKDETEKLVEQPGWALLSVLVLGFSTSARWFFYVWGAVFCMVSIPRISWVRRFFESAICQYLGKISFGFYLIHGPVMWTIGDRLFAAVGRPRSTAPEMIPEWINAVPLPNVGPLGLEINALLPQIILLPLTLWLAAVVTKMIDEPSIRLSKWMFSPPSPKISKFEEEMEAMLA